MYTIGADMELFVKGPNGFANMFDILPGSKKIPHRVKKGIVHPDGMAAEFGIDPVDNFDDFWDNLETVRTELHNMLGKDFQFMEDMSIKFDREWMETQNHQSLQLGCEPDFNAYEGGRANRPPPACLSVRCVGGHIHIGGLPVNQFGDEEHIELCCRVAKLLDEQVGVYSVLWDKDKRRRKMYGKAGAFRPKFYGLEWRVLSSAWTFTKGRAEFVFEGVERALNLLNTDYEPDTRVRGIINNGVEDHVFFNKNLLAEEARELA